MCHIIHFMLILGMLLCISCSKKNEQKKRLETELRMFKEKTITLPHNMLVKNYNKQMSPDTNLLHHPLKMVIYINKNGCTGCKLRALLPIYMFILENKHIENFAAIIILNTPDRDATDHILEDMHFRQTVFFDLDDSFERLNPHLPTNEEFHIFLMNGENKVLLVGNPVSNEELNKLYLRELNK